uniref:Uncharacterized protein n=1 Tax=Mesocestoides corti TaxID=53468 RepID=A0A5K3FXK0_MESCO
MPTSTPERIKSHTHRRRFQVLRSRMPITESSDHDSELSIAFVIRVDESSRVTAAEGQVAVLSRSSNRWNHSCDRKGYPEVEKGMRK